MLIDAVGFRRKFSDGLRLVFLFTFLFTFVYIFVYICSRFNILPEIESTLVYQLVLFLFR